MLSSSLISLPLTCLSSSAARHHQNALWRWAAPALYSQRGAPPEECLEVSGILFLMKTFLAQKKEVTAQLLEYKLLRMHRRCKTTTDGVGVLNSPLNSNSIHANEAKPSTTLWGLEHTKTSSLEQHHSPETVCPKAQKEKFAFCRGVEKALTDKGLKALLFHISSP